jgi:hypothetical protein
MPVHAHLSRARLELVATAGAPPLPREGHASTDVAMPCSPPSHLWPHVAAAKGEALPPREGKPCRRHHCQGFAWWVLWRRQEGVNEGTKVAAGGGFLPLYRLVLGDTGVWRSPVQPIYSSLFEILEVNLKGTQKLSILSSF